jgi:fructan beta-fructosidase
MFKTRLICFLCTLCFGLVLHAQTNETPTPQWRAVYHFTPEKNWTNDPNGLIYTEGKYHLYNQQNPFENKWGHMSWGHAISTDLIHWTHLPIAIPEVIKGKDTTWIFSGSTVKDVNNSSGFCKSPGCLVTVYTANQPNLKKESQFVAFSNDGGMSYTNYSGNPVIDLNKRDFRDPSVSWNSQMKNWLMVVVLPAEHKARFYSSTDLKNWELVSEFGNAGYDGSNWECPSLVKCSVEGKPGKYKWVLFISAAGPKVGPYMQYFVGDFDGQNFKNDNDPQTILTVDNGDSYYAAIPWNDQPDGKQIMIGWMVPNKQPTFPWRGQMSIPRDLSVRKGPNGYRLIQTPTTVISKNLDAISGKPVFTKSDIPMGKAGVPLLNLPGNAFWLDAELVVQPGSDCGFRVAQKKDATGKTIFETVIGFNADTKECYVDRTVSGQMPLPEKNMIRSAALESSDSTIRIQILFDKSSLEVFFANGEKVITSYIFPDADANGITAFLKTGNATIKKISVWDLSAIKNNE